MYCILMEDDNYIYYSEFSIPDLCKVHGKGLVFSKRNKILYEGWFLNNLLDIRGRIITKE